MLCPCDSGSLRFCVVKLSMCDEQRLTRLRSLTFHFGEEPNEQSRSYDFLKEFCVGVLFLSFLILHPVLNVCPVHSAMCPVSAFDVMSFLSHFSLTHPMIFPIYPSKQLSIIIKIITNNVSKENQQRWAKDDLSVEPVMKNPCSQDLNVSMQKI